MATSLKQSTKPSPGGVRNDRFVDEQIQRTRRTVKMVDVASALLVLASGFLGLLLLAAVLEHWIVPGGLNLVARCVLFAGGLAWAGWFVWRRLWPFVVGNVNPLYAAQQIEEHHPSLKNSLLNLLLLNRPGSHVSPAVMQTLEQQAAQRLSKVSNETAVDRSQLINMAAVFATLVVLFTLYKVLSPKDPLITAGRVLMPWADVMAPSRVTFENIEPGTTTVMRGDVLSPIALIRGLQDDEKAVLRFTTDDGQASQQPIAMHSSDNLHFECRLPTETKSTATGVQRNLRYYLQAGDARSREFRITVVSAPTISVTSVDYDYPDYTGYLDQQNVPLGDLRGIEGTTVTIHARSNEPIEEAHLDFEADGRRDLPLTHSDQTAEVSFQLALRPDRRTPAHSSYALRLTAAGGRQNRNPAQHSIEVLADQSPEVELLAPQEKLRDVRLNETVTIELEARDPDFALSEVKVLGEVGSRRVLEENLLEGDHKGRFAGRFRFLPTRHGLQEGDVVQYWAVARDNRTPSANSASTPRQRFRIVSPDPNRPEDEDAMAQREQNESGEAGQQSGEGESESNDSGQGESEQGESGQGQSGESESGQNEKGSQGEGESGQGEGMGQNSEGEGNQSGDQSGAGQSGSEQTSSGENQSGEGNSGQNQSGQRSDGNQQQDGQQSGGENSKGQSNQRQDGQNSNGQRDSSPVSSDGDNDAEAFDRIADHLDKQDRDSGGQGKQQGDQQNDAQPGKESGKQSGKQSDQDSGDPQQSDRGEKDPSAQQEQNGKQSDAAGNEGSQSSEDGNESNSPMGQESTTTGPAGKGNQANRETSEPQSDGDPQQGEEWEQNPSGEEQLDGKDPKSTDPGKRKNDTAGEQGGDQPEGGAKTNDNESPHDGTGDTGQNQSADEGSGESSERGTGNNSSDGGEGQQADRPTGKSSEDTPGKGSEVREGRGKKSGRAPRDEDPNQSPKRQRPEDPKGSKQEGNEGKPGQGNQSDRGQNSKGQDGEGEGENSEGNEPSDQSGDREGSTGDGTTEGAGHPGNRQSPPDKADGVEPGGDEVNLDYARKKTELILDKLGDMLRKKQVDDELLDKLGWTEEDMRRFVSRWQSRKARAEGNSADANQSQQELNDALRSLGLKPTGPTARSTTAQDNQRDFREGVRVPIPPEFQRRLRMYNEGVSKPRSE